MRWLILRLRREDRGAYSVMTAMLLVVMLGAVALAVDVGAMYAERTELQNGADAAALAVAQKCAVSETHCTTTAVTVADQYADRNAKDGLSDAQVVKLDTGANEIEIRATARLILRVTNSCPRRGDSWLNRMPLEACIPYDSR